MPTTVLIVDDELDIRSMLRTFLEGKDLRVLEATNGEEALVVAEKARPSLIIMDIMMQGGYGSTATKKLQANKATSEIPVILITGASVTELGSTLQNVNAHFLKKPFDIKTLDELVDKLLSKKGAS